jgi:hypothetical protein
MSGKTSLKRWTACCLLMAGIFFTSEVSTSRGGSAALVLAVDGTTDPMIQPFSEILSPFSIRLTGRASSVVFFDYWSCERVSVKGGVLVFGEKGYRLHSGVVTSMNREQCPERINISSSGEINGDVERGTGTSATAAISFPQRPDIILLGSRRESYTSIQIITEGMTIVNANTLGSHFSWPTSLAPLQGDNHYTLALIPKDQSEKPLTILFNVDDRRDKQTVLLNTD